MQMLHSEIPRDKLTTGWNDGFEANHGESDMNALRQRLERFNTYFTDLHRGDRVILDYLPARGTRVTVKIACCRVLYREKSSFRVYSSYGQENRPVSNSLKDDLLGC